MFNNIITISLLTDSNFLSSFKALGAGCATVSVAGSGVGIGIVFSGLMNAVSRNPSLESTLFNYAVLGFALIRSNCSFWFNAFLVNFIWVVLSLSFKFYLVSFKKILN